MFLVIENTPGYLPESEGVACDTFDEAVVVAKGMKEDLLELGYKVYGNIRRDHIYLAERHANDLGRLVAIEEVPF